MLKWTGLDVLKQYWMWVAKSHLSGMEVGRLCRRGQTSMWTGNLLVWRKPALELSRAGHQLEAELRASISLCSFSHIWSGSRLLLPVPSPIWTHMHPWTCPHRNSHLTPWLTLRLSGGRLQRRAPVDSWLWSGGADVCAFKCWAVDVTMWRTFKPRLKNNNNHHNLGGSLYFSDYFTGWRSLS